MILTISNISDKLSPIFAEKNIEKATLFGSHAKGLADEESDIDLFIHSEITGFSFFGLWQEIEDVIGKKIDLISSLEIIPGGRLDREIKNTGVVIYEK